MKTLRRSHDRGHVKFDWLDANHSFSFGEYYDPDYMGFSVLRVINEDKVIPSKGFPTHGHRDMEIITYVLEGSLAHKDSMGNGSTIKPGEVQYMSAGTGVLHSEFNASATEPVHLLQIWILPLKSGAPPKYEQKKFSKGARTGSLCLIVSPDGAEDSITIRQDAKIFSSILPSGFRIEKELNPQRNYWLQLAKGSLQVDDLLLTAGDGLAMSKESSLKILVPDITAEFLLFDLP